MTNWLQLIIDDMNIQAQRTRSTTQMTLGGMIDVLRLLPPNQLVTNLSSPHSYRGYYCDMAFEINVGTRSARELLADCQDALGREFTGYKGGEFLMGRPTPVWVSRYGVGSGMRIMGFNNGQVELEHEDDITSF